MGDRADAPSTTKDEIRTDATLFPSERATGNPLVDLRMAPLGPIYPIYGGITPVGLPPTEGTNPVAP